MHPYRYREADLQLSCISTIYVDIPRTFPSLHLFGPGAPLHESLLTVLTASACFSPYVGYVQGMSYIAAMFLLNMDSDFAVFTGLANLLHEDLFLRFFQFNTTSMRLHCDAFSLLLSQKMPKAHRAFLEHDITPDLYLYEWLMTLFTRTLSLDVAHRVWDNFFLVGSHFLFRVGLGIIHMFLNDFASMPFEKILKVLNRLPEDLNADVLFAHISKVPLTQADMDKALNTVEERRNAQAPSSPTPYR